MVEEHTNNDRLPEGYYLDNFQYLLAFVRKRYSHLLTKEELAYSRSFALISDAAKMLYVRLIQRKGPLFRPDKLSYPEIGLLDDAIAELADHSFLDYAEDASFEDLIPMLTKPELLQLPEARNLRASQRKADLAEELQAHQADLTKVQRIRPLGHEILRLYKLLFFGNMYQDLTEFVLNDLGVTPFESYLLDTTGRYFDHREKVDDTLSLHHLDILSHEVIAQQDRDLLKEFTDLLPDRSSDSRLSRQRDKIINRVARQFERFEQHDLAAELYRQSRLEPARERRARMLFKQNQFTRCFHLCTEMLHTPTNDQEKQFAIRFLHRHRKKAFVAFDQPSGFEAFLGFKPISSTMVIKKDSLKSVEQLACDWYAAHGWEAFYVENALLVGLFGLAFWDIIFAPAKGAFFNPFQRGPSDLFVPAFQKHRHEEIQQRLAALDDRAYLASLILSTFDNKYAITNYFVNWSVLDSVIGRRIIEKFLLTVSVKGLIQVFERLLADIRGNRSGLPDLIVFKDNEFKLVEVKGPGDKLQDNQTRWLWHFSTYGIPAEVLNLSYS